jgi:hypothetical protein
VKVSHRAAVAASLAIFAICSSASAELIYGIANQGVATNLIRFDSSAPAILQAANFVSGLQPNETIVGLDFRPATGQLYGLGSTSRLYTINTSTGFAAPVSGSSFTPALNGFSFGFDFNPNIDRIRVVSETNSNIVLNPNGAFQAAGTDVFYAAGDLNVGVDPNIVHSAYDKNLPLASPPNPASQLFGIDTNLDILVRQANSAGTLNTVGPLGLGVDVAAAGGFDISSATGTAYAALLPAGGSVSSLYRINLATGAATNLGVIDGGLVVTAMAIAPVPEPTTAGIALSALAGIAGFRRRVA